MFRTVRVLILVLATATFAAGCVSVPKRNPLPERFVDEARVLDLPKARWWGDEPPPWAEAFFETGEEALQERYPAVFGQPHHYLAISGGGSNGAFGAGLLKGWTESGTRPEFAIVTGISTGGLIAPFAFLGPEYDHVLEHVYTTTTTKEILKDRNLINTVTSDAGASSEPLQALIEEYVDEDLMKAIAAEHATGRSLYIGTTNLDSMRPVIWRLSAIANSGHPDALELMRSILLASASIPAAFPPVLIEVEAGGAAYDEMHVDGGAVSQVFLYPAGIHWDRVLELLESPEPPRVYVLRNSKLDPDWEAVKNKIFPIMERSVSSLIRSQGIGDLYTIYLETERDGLDFNLAYIPREFDAESKEVFDPDYMSQLFDLGYEMAKDGYPWAKLPPGMVEDPEDH